ncbi:MAG TPA: two pore domain potassium channel family protein [Cyanothece sp. UBA12306]|nr:two pore domain potassium channel family protein [Cyanothece sp. UBA12306]
MKSTWKFYSRTTGYTRLFIDLIILFFLAPLSILSPFIQLLISLFFFITLLLGVNALSFSPKTMGTLRIVAAIAFGADVIVFPWSTQLTDLTSLIANIFQAIFVFVIIMAIGFRITHEERVNADVIRGGICLYFLLGIFWFFLYQIVDFFDPVAFSMPEGTIRANLFYFSFTTLTTVGYGDISPINIFAMTLANAEALVGQIYPAIVIAKLVSLYESD